MRRPTWPGWLPEAGRTFGVRRERTTIRQMEAQVDTNLIDRVTAVLPSEQDAQAIRELARDLDELIAGVRRQATIALDALKAGNQPQAIKSLERLEKIE